jgi:hypothetical protein
MHRLIIGLAIAAAALLLVGCDSQPDAQRNEAKIQQDSYSRLSAAQPARAMNYSSTRETINFWIRTWDSPDKLSYVYLIASNGQLIGYYVFKGLPVSYCAALTPTYRIHGSSNGNLVLPAPSIDGVYYSGGQCNSYYGRDATTNSYIEYTVGNGINSLVYERPLPRQDVEPLGFTTIKGS